MNACKLFTTRACGLILTDVNATRTNAPSFGNVCFNFCDRVEPFRFNVKSIGIAGG